MNCVKCHAKIEADSKFCKSCGAAVNDADAASAASAPPATADSNPLSAAVTRAADPYRDPALEKQVWEGRPAWKAYYGVWLLWLLVSVAVLYAALKWTVAGSTGRTAAWLLIGASALTLLVREGLVIFSRRYRLTTQRLFLHRGILTQTTDQLELVRVEDVRLRQGVVDRIVNTGDIEIISSDETDNKLVLQSVSAPAEVAEHVRRNVRGARGKGALFVENV
ncbi:MAG TPA: PH domain-containing protein [Phycisphaerae bacterium]|nr:PH domain-containing protein [Phycisphaerae bacterium]